MKRRLSIGLMALFVFALHASGDPPAGTTADHTTTVKSGTQESRSNNHNGSGKADKKKNPDRKKGAHGTETNTHATRTDTSATTTESEVQSQPASTSDGSSSSANPTGSTTDSSRGGRETNTLGTNGSKASTLTAETDTSATNTTSTNPTPEHSGSNWLLFLVALTLVAVTGSFILVWGRLAGLETRLVKLNNNLESGLGPVTRDLSPLVGTPSRVIKIQELAEGISKELPALRSELAEVKKRLNTPQGGGGTRDKTPSPSQQSMGTYELEPPAEQDDASIHEVLRQLASDCVQSPITQSQAGARVGRGWDISAFGTGELPDGFIVDTGRGDPWFVPNTRRWSALRGESLFDVTGPDLPTARIIRIDSLPRVRGGGGALQLASGKRGRLEISIA